MLIASAAMFFAVAGSAFVVRARMAGHCCDRSHAPSHAQIRPVTPLVTSGGPCGQRFYRAPDGRAVVDYRQCPPEERSSPTRPSTER